MHRRTALKWTFSLAAAFSAGAVANRYGSTLLPAGEGPGHGSVRTKAAYVCPMHPHVVSDKPGTCPICGMALVLVKPAAAESNADMDMVPAVQIEPQVINSLGVKLARVSRTTLGRRIELPGFVQQIEPTQHVRVQAPFAARVVALHVKSGQWVEPGKPLVTLESAELRAAEQAHVVLLGHAVSAGAPSPDHAPSVAAQASDGMTLEASRAQLANLGLSSEDIQRLERNRTPSSKLTLYAPYAGMVASLQVAAGDSVNGGSMLFELSGMARASVLANAFQRDAAWIQNGQPVEVRLPHVSSQLWSGVVNEGAVSIDPNSQNIGVRLSFTAPAHLLKSAMYVLATIQGDVRRGVLAVPQDALIRTETDNRVVLALGNGRFRPVLVRPGIETGDQVEILSGLKPGDQVVVSAQFLIDSESSLQASFRRMSAD